MVPPQAKTFLIPAYISISVAHALDFLEFLFCFPVLGREFPFFLQDIAHQISQCAVECFSFSTDERAATIVTINEIF